jgi:hypothetical protein
VRERRGRLATNNRRGLADELVVFERRHHEKGKVYAARDVARKDRVADVPAPYGQTLTLTLLEVAPAHNSPPCIACKHQPARLHLVIEVHDTGEARNPADDIHEHFDLPRVHVLAIAGDVPST